MTCQQNRWRLDGWASARILWVFLGCLLSTTVRSQPDPLTLQDALRLAKQNYSALKAKGKLIRLAEEGVQQTRTQRLLSLRVSEQLNYGTTNATAGIILPFGTIIPTTGSFANEASFQGVFGSITTLYSEWSPITFGQYQARLNEAREAVQMATADLANDEFSHQVRVTQTYLELLAIDRFRDIQEQDVERITTLSRIVDRLTKNGLRPGVDTEFANAEVAKAKLALFEAQDREARLRAQLATMLGLETKNWQLDSTFVHQLPMLPRMDPNPANLHPQLALQQQTIRLTDARRDVLRKSYRPRLSLLGASWARGSGIAPSGEIRGGLSGLPPVDLTMHSG